MDQLLLLYLCIMVLACTIQAHERVVSQPHHQQQHMDGWIVGWNRCACQPQEYELAFDFSLTCADSTVEQNAGVQAFACDIASQGRTDDNDDGSLIPASVNTIQILELDAQQQVQSQIVFEEWKSPFRQGDRLWFASITGKARRLATDAIPTGMQIIVHATSVQGTPLMASFFLQFKSGCSDSYPALREGDTAGWVQFRTLRTPDEFICPIVSSESFETLAPAHSPNHDHHYHNHDHGKYGPHHHHHRSRRPKPPRSPPQRTCKYWNLYCYLRLCRDYLYQGYYYYYMVEYDGQR